MRSFLAGTVLILALAFAAPAPAAIVGELDVRVLTPPSYAKDPDRVWPVVYVIPGSGEIASEAIDSLELRRYAARDEAVIVTVSEIGGLNNFLADYIDGSHRYESWFIKYLLPWVERNYRVGERGIVGYSAGGYSATAIASRHPGKFSAVGAISGVVDLEDGGPAGGYMILAPVIAFDGPEVAFGIWGEPVTDAANFHAHNPVALASSLKGTEAVFLSSGSGRPANLAEARQAGIGLVPLVYVESSVARWTANYSRALTAAGVEHALRAHEGLHFKEHFRSDFAAFWPEAVAALR